MSTIETSIESPRQAAPSRTGLISRLGQAMRATLLDAAAAVRARRTARVLHELSDHELKDIGLVRSDIGRVAGLRLAKPLRILRL